MSTSRWGIPTLAAGQAQKEITHNEALVMADALLHPVVDGPPVSAPPPTPQEGDCVLIASGASEQFAGHEHALAIFTPGGWRFIAARIGLRCTDATTGLDWSFDGVAWTQAPLESTGVKVDGAQVIGARTGPIADVSGGATVDAEARGAIQQILIALRQHGLIAP